MTGVRKRVLALSLAALLGLPTPAPAETQEDDGGEEIRQVFFPYRQGPPRLNGVPPGATLTQRTWQAAEGVLPPELARLLQAGEFAIDLQATTDSPLPEAYIAATLQGAGRVKLGNDGELQNYVAGLPFPLVSPSDPQAGLKVAWNLRYRNLGESVKIQYTLQLRGPTGRVQRSMDFRHFFRFGLHRAEPGANIARWQREGVLYKEYLQALAPLDLEGFQQLRLHYDRDTRADEEWVYDPRTRRMRKTA